MTYFSVRNFTEPCDQCIYAFNLPLSPRFLAFKTPLDERYDDQVPPANRFSPTMLFQSMKAFKVKIGLWIDLTKTSR